MKGLFLTGFVVSLILTGCSITTSVTPVGEGKVADLCIRKNSLVQMAGFLPELEAQIRSHGVATRTFESELPADCRHHMEYTANWKWDLAMYLEYAELKVYENVNLIGEAIYNARWGSANMSKFGPTKGKLKPLVDELFGRKSGTL